MQIALSRKMTAHTQVLNKSASKHQCMSIEKSLTFFLRMLRAKLATQLVKLEPHGKILIAYHILLCMKFAVQLTCYVSSHMQKHTT